MAICKPPLESKHMMGKFYLTQLIEDVKHKHLIRQADQQQNH